MCLVVTVLIVVTLNALLAQTAFQMQAEQDRVETLQRDAVLLTEQAARLSSPVVVATWARRHDMVTPAPGEVHILRVPGSGR